MGRNVRDKTKVRCPEDRLAWEYTSRDWRALTSNYPTGRVADVCTGVAAMTGKRCMDKPDFHSNLLTLVTSGVLAVTEFPFLARQDVPSLDLETAAGA